MNDIEELNDSQDSNYENAESLPCVKCGNIPCLLLQLKTTIDSLIDKFEEDQEHLYLVHPLKDHHAIWNELPNNQKRDMIYCGVVKESYGPQARAHGIPLGNCFETYIHTRYPSD